MLSAVSPLLQPKCVSDAQEAAAETERALAAAHERSAASDADWEGRMKEAVSSAEQWKEFAEKLGADKDATEAALSAARASLQVHTPNHTLFVGVN